MNTSLNQHKQQMGIALLSIMIIVVLVAALATQMHWEQKIATKRLQNHMLRNQAIEFSTGAEKWAREILNDDGKEHGAVDSLAEDWAQALPALPIDGGQLQGRIQDLQGRFNLNNLIDTQGNISPRHVEQFRRLLQKLEVDSDLANAVVDWIDSDTYPEFPGGAEDATYASLPAPYRTANHYISHPSELMSIQGFTREFLRKLEPFVTTLPIGTEININTASIEVILSLSDTMSQGLAQQIVSERDNGAFESVQDLESRVPALGNGNLGGLVSFNSRYFVTEVEVKLGEYIYRQHSYMFRDQSAQTGVFQRIRSPKRLPELQGNESLSSL